MSAVVPGSREAEQVPDEAATEIFERLSRASTFLAGLAPDTRRALGERAHVRMHAVGTTLVDQDDVGDTLHLLVDGAIQRRTRLPDDRDVLLDIVAPVALLDTQVVLLGRRMPHRLVAITPVRLAEIRGRELRMHARSSPTVGVALARDLADQLWGVEADRVLLAHLDAMTRVVHRLVHLGTAWGVRRAEQIDIPLALTQEDLGTWAGVSRESAVKALHSLRRRGLVRTGRRQVVIRDLSGLRRLAEQRGAPATARPPHARGQHPGGWLVDHD